MFDNHLPRSRSKLPLFLALGVAVALAAVLMFLPWPHTIESTYTLEPASSVPVLAPRAGAVGAVLVKPGDVVTRGQVLAKFDVAAATETQTQLEEQLADLQKQADTAGLTAAMDRVKRAEEQPASVADLDRAHEALVRLESKPGVSDLSAQLKLANESLARVQEEQQMNTIVAANAGTIGTVSVKAGDALTNGQAVATVDETTKLKAVLSVPAGEPVKAGNVVTLDLADGKRRLRIEDTDAEGKVITTIENPTGSLAVGSTGKAVIEGPQRSLLGGAPKDTVSMR